MYRELDVYRSSVYMINVNVWWKLTTRCPYLTRQVSSVMAVLMGVQPKGLEVHYRKCYESTCKICCSRETDSAVHVLMECNGLKEHRDKHLTEISKLMPYAMKQDFIGCN